MKSRTWHSAALAFGVSMLAMAFGAATATAADTVSFKDKTVTMIIGYPPGGGTDASGRLLAQFLTKHLPGNPNMIVRNMPGAEGLVSLNYFVEQVKPDGLTITMGSSVQVDPLSYRVPQVHYDPLKFHYVGGVGRGGSMIIIDNDAVKRILDPKGEPVVVGSIGGVPRSAMQTVAWGIEHLGWNAKWVVGYRGTSDVMIALERGEVNVTSTGNMFQLAKLLDTGKFKILAQTGTLQGGKVLPRPEFADAPLFPDMMKGKLKDPIIQKAFDYWQSIVATDKWLALPPDTPADIIATYNKAFEGLMKDQEFTELGKKISEDFEPMSRQDVEILIKTLANTPNEALGYMKIMLNKQGLNVQ
jgi:hypothetical protein